MEFLTKRFMVQRMHKSTPSRNGTAITHTHTHTHSHTHTANRQPPTQPTDPPINTNACSIWKSGCCSGRLTVLAPICPGHGERQLQLAGADGVVADGCLGVICDAGQLLTEAGPRRPCWSPSIEIRLMCALSVQYN